jgi:hypothetical protein
VSGVSAGLRLSEGEHTIEVMHPDFESETVRFVAERSRNAVVDVRLDPRS